MRGRRRRLTVALGIVTPLVLLVGVAGLALSWPDPEARRVHRELEAENALAEGQLELARMLYTRLVAEDPACVRVRHNLMLCLWRMDRREEALVHARRVLQIESDHVPAHRLVAADAIRRNDRAEAAATLRAAWRGAPEDPAGRRALAHLLLFEGLRADEAGWAAQAVRRYEEVLELDPDNSVALNNLAVRLAADPGTARRAVRLAERAVALEPGRAAYRDTLRLARAGLRR